MAKEIEYKPSKFDSFIEQSCNAIACGCAAVSIARFQSTENVAVLMGIGVVAYGYGKLQKALKPENYETKEKQQEDEFKGGVSRS